MTVEGIFDAADENGSAIADSYFVPQAGEADPRPIMARLIAECPEFEDLRLGEATIMIVMRRDEKIKQGRRILGTMNLPVFMGELRPFATWMLAVICGRMLPDYVMILEAEWWMEATPKAREALVYHELCHCHHAVDKDGEKRFTEEGLPIWDIQGHDIEEFNAVVRRYGAWKADIKAFLDAAREGGAIR